jgi:hypothetical protein
VLLYGKEHIAKLAISLRPARGVADASGARGLGWFVPKYVGWESRVAAGAFDLAARSP